MSDQLNPGDRSDAIALIANTLTRLGFLTTPSDLYDENLTQGIKAFQQERGLTSTGVINEITKRALEEARFKLGDRVLSFNPVALIRGDDVSNLQQRLIQRIDLDSELGERLGHGGVGAVKSIVRYGAGSGLGALEFAH